MRFLNLLYISSFKPLASFIFLFIIDFYPNTTYLSSNLTYDPSVSHHNRFLFVRTDMIIVCYLVIKSIKIVIQQQLMSSSLHKYTKGVRKVIKKAIFYMVGQLRHQAPANPDFSLFYIIQLLFYHYIDMHAFFFFFLRYQ